MDGPGDIDEPERFFDEQAPFDAEESAAQIAALLDLLDAPPRRVLDLGAGAGRVAVPVAQAGHRVTALDRDGVILERCVAAAKDAGCARRVRVVTADFLEPWPARIGRFDMITCLGNTLMLVSDVDAAIDLLRRAAALLQPGGAIIIEDLPALYFDELTGGNWGGGISEDGAGQIVWVPGDALFALRWGDAVDPGWPVPRAGERLLRLWSAGALRLAAAAAGLSVHEAPGEAALLILRPQRRPAASASPPSREVGRRAGR